MAFGPSPVGFGYFLLVKFAGYSFFSNKWINKKIEKELAGAPQPLVAGPQIPPALKSGFVRTIIGAVVGIAVGWIFWKSVRLIEHYDNFVLAFDLLFFMLLFPVRIGEWFFLLETVYSSFSFTSSERRRIIGGGIVVSFALDFLGIVTAMVTPGGFWVC